MANVVEAIGNALTEGVSGLAKGAADGIFSGLAKIVASFKADPTISAQLAAHGVDVEAELEKVRISAELTLAQNDLALVQAQTRINELEAQSPDRYASRARPTVLWVCCLGLTYQLVAYPFLVWASVNFGWKVPPVLPGDVLQTLLFGLLGLTAARSFDKAKGTSK